MEDHGQHAQVIKRAHLALQSRPPGLQATAARCLPPSQAPDWLRRSLLQFLACLRP